MKKNGFTLIELLAVIVILAIIALIATPIVLNIINSAKESSNKRTIENYITAVKQSALVYQMNNPTTVVEGTYSVQSDGSLKCNEELAENTCENISFDVRVDGDILVSGNLTLQKIDESYVVAGDDLKIKNTDVLYQYSDSKANLSETPIKCFTYDNNVITDYKCYEDNEYGYETITDVVIPKRINGVIIDTLGENSFSVKDLTSIKIPMNIKTISSSTFNPNENLTKVIYDDIEYTDYNDLSTAFSNNDVSLDSTAFSNTGLENAPEECVVAGTKVTLANGDKINVEDLTGDEELLTWNFDTGEFEVNKIIFLHKDSLKSYKVINLYFSDNTTVGVVMEHGFFDIDLGKWVYLDYDADKFIGHRFVKMTNDGWTTVKLEDVKIETKLTSVYSPITSKNLNYYVEDMLSMSGGIKELMNIYDYDTKTLSYDTSKKIKDLTKYGIFNYSNVSNMIDINTYNDFSVRDLNVAIGKNNITIEDIYRLIATYKNYNSLK